MDHTIRNCPRCGNSLSLSSEKPYTVYFNESINTSLIYGVSSSLKINKKLYFGSFVDAGFV